MKNRDIVLRICIHMLRFIHCDMNSKSVAMLAQFIKFCMIGVTNTALSYALNIVALVFLKPRNLSFDYIIANLFAFFLSVAWSYFWNSRLVFQVNSHEKYNQIKTLLRTYVAYSVTGIVLNNLLSWLWIEKLQISKYVAPLINLIISVPINFLMNKFWAFRER